ncbi:hypothetical protein Dsin_032960 [Dipteronia sinensis]|uniref:Uncharacterized protein n=1 Tax=Dipteronia sinensis TaxID=43782 RepID=A0AAE0DHE7_9ROSI|nr:hypothetical protein Dsin_032960 [Dipteronia sinensis]
MTMNSGKEIGSVIRKAVKREMKRGTEGGTERVVERVMKRLIPTLSTPADSNGLQADVQNQSRPTKTGSGGMQNNDSNRASSSSHVNVQLTLSNDNQHSGWNSSQLNELKLFH